MEVGNMKGCQLNRLQIVLMMLTDQKIDKALAQTKLYSSFSELNNSTFNLIPDFPDPQIPKVAINSERLSVSIFLNRYNFIFSLNNEENLCKTIEQSVERVYNFVKDIATGTFRLGIVLNGKFGAKENIEAAMSRDGLKIKKDFEELQYAVRRSEAKPLKADTNPIKINKWIRYNYVCDGNKNDIIIDINTHLQTPLDFSSMSLTEIYKELLETIIKDCLNDAE